MRHVDEYREPAAVDAVVRQIRETTTRTWTLMEVCGGQTHSILKFGLDELLPRTVSLVHGPGCPVCVTPLEMIDRAVAVASRPDVIFCSFGDMLRVPGSREDLLSVKARGGDIRIVYSPLDAVKLARQHGDRRVVFFAVGFETTAPANAMAVHRAAAEGLDNFSVLVAHVLVPPALEACSPARTRRSRGCWPQATSARSRDIVTTSPSPAGTGSPSWSLASSPWTCCGACWPRSDSSSAVRRGWRTSTRGRCGPRATRLRCE